MVEHDGVVTEIMYLTGDFFVVDKDKSVQKISYSRLEKWLEQDKKFEEVLLNGRKELRSDDF